MSLIIDDFNFEELECMKYWAPPNSWTEEKKRDTSRSRIFSGEWIGSRKYDGGLYCFIKDEEGNCILRGRSKSVKGIYLNKYDWVPHLHDFFNILPPGTCLLGEIVFPNNEGSNKTTTIMGCLSEKAIARQKDNPISYYIFDVLAWNSKNLINTPIKERIDYLETIDYLIYQINNRYVFTAKYYEGKELWDQLQLILSSGGEGVVILKKDSKYQPGKRPSKECQKIKKELTETIDAFFTGRATPPTKEYTGKDIENWSYWLNLKTNEKLNQKLYKNYFDGEAIIPITKNYFYNYAGSLEVGVMKEDKIFPIGTISGLSEEIKANHKDYAMKCVELGGMQLTEDGAIRHGKLLRFRDDLTPKECTYEKIFG